MDQPTGDNGGAGGKLSPEPRLSALINSWRDLAASELQKAESVEDASLNAKLKSRAEVFEECAESLESVLKGHARANRAQQLNQLHPGSEAKARQRLVRPRARNNKLKDRLIDVSLVLLFLTIIAGCAYIIIKMMTRWSVEGLG